MYTAAQPILVALAFCVASLSRCLRRRRRLWRLSSLGRRKVPVNVAYGEGEPCCICFGTEDEANICLLPCRHSLHAGCYRSWICTDSYPSRDLICPICRRKVTVNFLQSPVAMGGQQSAAKSSAAPGPDGQGDASSSNFGKGRTANNQVQLAVSVLGGVPGATAYHSSVIVNGHEYFFSDGGIASTSDLSSHKNPQMPDSKPEVIDMGMSPYTGSQMREALERYFISGTCHSGFVCLGYALLR
eukprot:g30725.t1